MGLVINADCDLANEKTDGVVAYLPIYSFRDFLSRFWAPAYLNEIAGNSTKKILDIIKADETEAENLRTWLLSSPADMVMAKLVSLEQLKAAQTAQIEDHLARVQICQKATHTPLKRFGALCRRDKDPEATAKKQLAAARKAMGEGHFFISDLVGHAEVGFVVRMRRIYTISHDRCFTSTANQRASSDGRSATAVRLARLTPLYQFKVAQLFAQQYSRIGLPDDITALGDVAIEMLASILVREEL